MKKIMNILWNSLKYIKLDMIGYFLCCHLNIFLSHRVLLFCSWGIVSLQMKWDSYLAWQYICKLFPCYRQLVSFWWPKKLSAIVVFTYYLSNYDLLKNIVICFIPLLPKYVHYAWQWVSNYRFARFWHPTCKFVVNTSLMNNCMHTRILIYRYFLWKPGLRVVFFLFFKLTKSN